MNGPILKGKKVILTPRKVSQAKNYVAWFSDPEVNKYLGREFNDLNLKKEKGYLKKAQKEKNQIIWAIYTTSGVHIGSTSLHKIDQQNKKAGWGIVIGNKEYWNQGLCTDSLKTIVRFAFKKLKLNRIELLVFPGNKGGIKCYTRCGFKKEGLKRQAVFKGGKYYDEYIMAILRSEYGK